MRQGCQFSPKLFNWYLEPYVLSVAHYQFLDGFKLQSVEVKLIGYADDIAVLYRNLESVTEVVSLTKHFCEASVAAC